MPVVSSFCASYFWLLWYSVVSSNASCIRRLERAHSKILSSLPSYHHTSNLGITLAECRTFIQLYRFSKYYIMFHLHMQGLFTYATDVTGHTGKNPHRLYVPRIRTNYGKRSLQYWGTLIWNRLTVELYNATSVR